MEFCVRKIELWYNYISYFKAFMLHAILLHLDLHSTTLH